MNEHINFIINQNGFEFLEDSTGRHVIYQLKKYETISSLTHDHQEIINCCLALALCVNFLIKGNEFRVIKNPEEYRSLYLADIEKEEKRAFSEDMPRRESWGNFDLNKIDVPCWHDEQLVFYAERNVTRIPYCVIYVPKKGDNKALINYSTVKKVST